MGKSGSEVGEMGEMVGEKDREISADSEIQDQDIERPHSRL